MEELIQLIAKTYGLAGLIMLSPFVAVVFLWRHTVAQTKEIARVNEQRGARGQGNRIKAPDGIERAERHKQRNEYRP